MVSPTLESHSVTERNDVLIRASAWTSLENIMLSGNATHTSYDSFICNVPNRQPTEGSRLAVARDLGEGVGEATAWVQYAFSS